MHLPHLLLHLNTEDAEYYTKFLSFVIHSMNNFLVTKIAYFYFSNQPLRAQMLAFILLANEHDRIFNQMQANDQLLGFFIFLTIYLISLKRPYLASSSFSIGLSIKAGGLLLIPALLGTILYRFGLKKLVVAIYIICQIQYSLGYVFFLRDWDSYWIDSRILGSGHGNTTLGA